MMVPWLAFSVPLLVIGEIATGTETDQAPETSLVPTATPMVGSGARDEPVQLAQTTAPTAPPLAQPIAPPPPLPSPTFGPTVAGNAYEAATTAAPSGGAFGAPTEGFGTLASTSVGGIPQMIGDQGPFSIRQVSGFPRQVPGFPQPPPLPSPRTRSLLAPSVRGFKIADNQSPFPQDRVFFTFNYFYNVNAKVNRFFEAPITNLGIYRYVFGYEKTFNQGMGSIGLRLPLNSAHADTRQGLINQGGTSTALGDLTIYLKYVFAYNPRTGDLVSAGFAVTPPTGPNSFANAPFLRQTPSLHTTELQPFVGYYFARGDFFLHGFTSFSFPVNYLDVTMLYNDLGLGYYLLRDPDPNRLLTAIVPTFEAHVNTPLNHRGAYNLSDRAGTPDVVNLTSGVNFEFRHRLMVTLGIVEPVTGPRPFDLEVVALLNFRFGGALGPRRARVPIIGG